VSETALGLAWIACVAKRDLQGAARRAGGADRLWSRSPAALADALGLAGERRSRVIDGRREFDAEAARRSLTQSGLAFIEADRLPRRLGEIYDPPFGIFARGTDALGALGSLDEGVTVAVVGARASSAGGAAFARRLAYGLARRGACVVSGMARGIDAAAHTGALDAGGTTIAVLGCGVDVAYPRRNAPLARAIEERGALVSEYWPGTPPAPWRFPARNRIVAGLADAVVVVEAGEGSGALITADFAIELGRPVLATPGPPWHRATAGGNALLKAGATMCEGVEDVVEELPRSPWQTPSEASDTSLSARARAVGEALALEPRGADALAEHLEIAPSEVRIAISELELAGILVRGAGGVYALGREG
jgi:DNA processing protein